MTSHIDERSGTSCRDIENIGELVLENCIGLVERNRSIHVHDTICVDRRGKRRRKSSKWVDAIARTGTSGY